MADLSLDKKALKAVTDPKKRLERVGVRQDVAFVMSDFQYWNEVLQAHIAGPASYRY